MSQADPIIGKGKHRYSFRRDWARLPRWWAFGEDSVTTRPPQTAVQGAVAANRDVYVLARAPHPVTVFDAEGNFITSWGEGRFTPFVHGLTIAPDGNIWITDSGNHSLTEHRPDGTLLRTLGTPDFPAPTFWGNPFNMPTGVAFAANGDLFVSDGYGNHRVHCFAPDLTRRHSWGSPGSGPGQFGIVHYVDIDAKDRVYIVDREYDRIQLFDTAGTHLADWTGFDQPSDLAFGKRSIVVGGRDGLSVWSAERKLLMRVDRHTPHTDALHIHGVWLDAEENIYLAMFDRTVSKLTRLT